MSRVALTSAEEDQSTLSALSLSGLPCVSHGPPHRGPSVSTLRTKQSLPATQKVATCHSARVVSIQLACSAVQVRSYLLLGLYGRDGRQQTADAAGTPHPLPASAARHIAVEVECHRTSRCQTHTNSHTPPCPSSTGRLTTDELVSRSRPEV